MAPLSRGIICASRGTAGARSPSWAAEIPSQAARESMQSSLPRTTAAIEGVLPSHLVGGCFLRAGPNPAHVPLDSDRYHWFDGDGMAFYVRFDSEESVSVGADYIRTQGFVEEERAGRALYAGLRAPPTPELIMRGLASKLAAPVPDKPWWVIQQKNSSNNAFLVLSDGRVLSLYEAGAPYEIEVTNSGVRTLGLFDFGGSALFNRWRDNFIAHPKKDSETGEIVGAGYDLLRQRLMVWELDPLGALRRRTEVSAPRASLMHDIALTSSRVLLFDGPLVFDLAQSMRGERPFNFFDDSSMRVGILPRTRNEGDAASKDPIWIDLGPGFAYHALNAFDVPGKPERVVLYAALQPRTTAAGLASLVAGDAGSGEGRGPAYVHRWEIDVAKAAVVQSERVCDVPSEFPQVSPLRVGLPFEFGYSARFSREAQIDAEEAEESVPTFDAILKHRFSEGDRSCVERVYELEEGWVCGDFVFVPSSAEAEDDGHLLLLTHDRSSGGEEAEQTTALQVICARSFERVCRVAIPARIPLGFHAAFVPPPNNA